MRKEREESDQIFSSPSSLNGPSPRRPRRAQLQGPRSVLRCAQGPRSAQRPAGLCRGGRLDGTTLGAANFASCFSSSSSFARRRPRRPPQKLKNPTLTPLSPSASLFHPIPPLLKTAGTARPLRARLARRAPRADRRHAQEPDRSACRADSLLRPRPGRGEAQRARGGKVGRALPFFCFFFFFFFIFYCSSEEEKDKLL